MGRALGRAYDDPHSSGDGCESSVRKTMTHVLSDRMEGKYRYYILVIIMIITGKIYIFHMTCLFIHIVYNHYSIHVSDRFIDSVISRKFQEEKTRFICLKCILIINPVSYQFDSNNKNNNIQVKQFSFVQSYLQYYIFPDYVKMFSV